MKKDKPKFRGKEVEVRYHGKTSLIDEVIAKDAHIHIEQMGDDCFWFVIQTPNERVNFNFFLAEKEITDEENKTYRPIILRLAWEREREKRNESDWGKSPDYNRVAEMAQENTELKNELGFRILVNAERYVGEFKVHEFETLCIIHKAMYECGVPMYFMPVIDFDQPLDNEFMRM